ncbi:MAG TPA: hypothetical protein VJP77_00775, partial [Planctomycetota bacterium]|nr:hypothetical protein [Planctomycetota bacterium]
MLTLAGLGGLLLAALGAVWIRSRRAGRWLGVELVPPVRAHYIQAGVQLCIYAYWGYYWRDVYSAVPLIVSQLFFVYAFEALVAWSRGRSWRLGCGPLPIILSTNLFLWFREDWFFLQFAMIAAAILSKEFLKWTRDGQRVHVFNPSAFALCLASVVLLATGTTELTTGVEIATTLYRPPHIYLEIFLLGLIVQYFFSTTLMTLSAAGTLVLLNVVYTEVTGVYHFVDANIPAAVFLGFHLLVTDPKTSPRTGVGKVLFGALYGLGIWLLYGVLGSLGLPQFYDKLLPVPILNLSVRLIDHVARHGLVAGLSRREATVSPRRLNLLSMGAWTALFVAMLGTGFVEARHAGNSVAFWMKAFEERRPGAGEKLLQKLELRALAGSGSAHNVLGTFHLDGRLVRRDPDAAAVFFASACELGHLPGCANVVKQWFGTGRARSEADVARALEHLEAAAVA